MEIRKQELQTIGFDYTFGMSGKVSVATAQYMPGNDPYQDYLHERGLLEVLQAHYQEHFTSFSGRRGFTPAALTEEDRQDTFIAGHAADWIASYDRQNPFFLWVEFLDPHPPADPPEPYAGMYDWEEMRLPLGDTPHPQLSVEHLRRFRAGYYAMITALDAQVGRILEALKESGQIDHTVIVFAGDQGSMLGDHGLWGKGDYYKGSVNSPLIIAGPPGWFIPGQVIDRPVETLDLAPTILELAGASAADQRKSYGESLLPLLTGKGTYSRTAAFAETAEWKVAVTDRFKYVIHPKGNILFDLQECPDELVNLIGQQPGTEAAMAGVIEAWICNTTPQAGEAGVTYTFAGPDTCKARLEQMNGVAVSEVAYIQGTAASGGGLSAPAYRLADPENRLFALSSRDIADPVAAYDETHSRFVFSLTAAPDVSIDFRAASLSMTLLGMVADTNAYTVSAYIAYNINQTGWVSQGIRQRVRNVEYDRTDTMGSVLYDAQTGAPLSEYGLPPEANVYARTVSWSLAQADAMAPGSTVEFAVFVFDDKNGNARYYAGADNICVDGIQIIKGD